MQRRRNFTLHARYPCLKGKPRILQPGTGEDLENLGVYARLYLLALFLLQSSQ
ncbi:MAG: hypothetical protein ABWK01_01475 [Infirmifilum sp.]